MKLHWVGTAHQPITFGPRQRRAGRCPLYGVVQTRVRRYGAKLQPRGPGCSIAQWASASLGAGVPR